MENTMKWHISTNEQSNIYSFATREEAEIKFDDLVKGEDSYDWKQEGDLMLIEIHSIATTSVEVHNLED
jgi:hypothetical protein